MLQFETPLCIFSIIMLILEQDKIMEAIRVRLLNFNIIQSFNLIAYLGNLVRCFILKIG